MSVIGLLLAAGRGHRMGGNKQFHIVPTSNGDKPLVAAAFDTIASVCDEMVVVLGHRAGEVAVVLAPRPFEVVEADPDAPMIDSIKAGLRAILSRGATLAGFHSPPPRYSGEGLGEGLGEGYLILQLGDHPSLEPSTLDQIFTIAAEHPDKAVMPTYKANGGHPVVIPAKVAEQILASPCPDGLRQFWLDHPELCLRVPVDDAGVTLNINVP